MFSFHKFFSTALPLAVLAGALVPLSSAAPMAGPGGLLFDNFACSVSRDSVLAAPSGCSQIFVRPLVTSQNTLGIRFTSDFFAPPYSFDRALIGYQVQSPDGIGSVGLAFNGAYLGLAISSVIENVYSGNRLVGSAAVYYGAFVGCDRTDNILLNGLYHDLTVVKEIDVVSLAGLAGQTIIDQTFGIAPEPGSAQLLSCCGILLALYPVWRKCRDSLNN